MNGTKKLSKKLSLGLGAVLLAANAFLFVIGPQGVAAGEGCEEECWCFGDVCNEEEIAFDQCEPGFHWVTYEGKTELVLDPIYDSGELTHESCGGAN